MSTLLGDLKPVYFSKDPILVRVRSEKMTGSGPYTPSEPNLSCYISVEQEINGNWTSILTLTAAYDVYTATVDIDLSSAVAQLEPPLPGGHLFENSQPTSPSAYTRTFAKYRIKHADQYGTPLVTDATATSDEFTCIRGASSYYQGLGSDVADRAMTLLHSYKVNLRGYKHVTKTIAPDQPDILYLWLPSNRTVTTTAAIKYSDGTAGTKTRTNGFTGTAGIYSIYVSMQQMGINEGTKEVDSYILTVTCGGVSETIRYTVDNSPNDYAVDILYDNGCGGMEVVRMSGRQKLSHNVSSRKVTQQRWYGTNFRSGLSRSTDLLGAPTLELNTGYQNKEYLLHLSQMIYSDVFVIDHARSEIYRYVMNTSSLTPIDDTKDIESFTISITRAIDSPTASTLRE